MLFLCVFCVSELKGFRSKSMPKMRQFFEVFVKFQIKTYFSASVKRNDYIILVLTISVVSTDMERVSGKCING